MILADCGFSRQDHVGMYMAEIKMPPFTKGEKQLEKLDMYWNRGENTCRTVEPVIGILKQKYTILQEVLPINYCDSANEDSTIAVIDKIISVHCALVNLCPSNSTTRFKFITE